MKIPTRPDNESARLEALHSLNILDTPPEERFDRLTRLAQKIFNVPITLISLVDKDRQWFKSRQGTETTETARNISFCGHAILQNSTLIVEDALQDARFADNPLVIYDPNIRFYAGHPLLGPGGHKIGTFCLIDHAPRTLTAHEQSILEDLAAVAQDELNIALLSEAFTEQQEFATHLSNVLDNLLDGIILFDNEGIIQAINPATQNMFGYDSTEAVGININMLVPDLVPPDTVASPAPLLSIGREMEGYHRDGFHFPLLVDLSEYRQGRQILRIASVRNSSVNKYTGQPLS
jgi:PAS domain S-box-containing protein